MTPQQKAAVDVLAAGVTVTDAATAVGVSRQTVSGWLNSNFGVQAALNRRRHELWSEVSDRLRPLVPKALDTVATPLDAGDVKPALVLKATGLSDLRPTGSTDTGELEADAEDRDYALSLRG